MQTTSACVTRATTAPPVICYVPITVTSVPKDSVTVASTAGADNIVSEKDALATRRTALDMANV